MKILFVIDTLNRGGAEQSVVNLLPVLKARGHECAVAALRAPYNLGEALDDAGVKVYRLNLSHPWNIPEGVWKLARVIRGGGRGGYDVVVSHLFLGAVYTALTRPVAPRPARVALFHNLDYDVIRHTSPVRRLRKAGHLALLRRYMDGFVGVSDAVAKHYHGLLGEGYRVATIYNSLPVKALQRDPRFKRNRFLGTRDLDNETFVFATAARLVSQKGHRYLIEALEILGRSGARPMLLLLGDGPLRAELEADVRRRGLGNQVRFLGAVAHDEVLLYLQATDAFVLPSLIEGFGIAPAEAMLMGCPVLATRIGAVVEVIAENESGLLVPAADAAALAEAMARLMAEPELCRRLAAAGRDRIVAHFDTPIVAEGWERFLTKLVTERDAAQNWPAAQKKTKVLFIVPTLESGGAERVMVNLLNHLDRERFEPMLAVGKAVGPYLADLRDDIEVIELGETQSWRLVPAIAAAVRRTRPQVVFSTLYTNFAVLLGRVAFPAGTRVVVRESSVLGPRLASVAAKDKWRARFIKLLLHGLYRHADLIVCQSEFARDEMRQLLNLNDDRTQRIYNPVDIDSIEGLAREGGTPFTGAGPNLLAVGSFRDEKGYDILLPAFARLHAKHPEAMLTIVGEGKLLPAMRQLAHDLKIDDAIDFAGSQTNPFRWMRHADLVISASRYDSFSNVLLEAMACGTPSVATQCPGGNREIVEPNITGWLAPAGDSVALAATLERVLPASSSLDRNAIAQSCRRRFAAQAIVSQYESAFIRLSGRD